MPLPPYFSTALAWLAEKLRKVLIWFACVALFAVLPLGLSYNSAKMHHKPIDLNTLIKHGELYLMAAAIGADALGRVVSKLIPRIFAKAPVAPTKKAGLWELILLLACLFPIVLSASSYSAWVEISPPEVVQSSGSSKSSSSAAEQQASEPDISYMVNESCLFFGAVLVVGISVILTVDE